MQDINLQLVTTDRTRWPYAGEKDIEVSVLRLDKLHPVISGNKWFKLQFYLEEATGAKKSAIVTFGGAYSNHIIATAAACSLKGLASIGIIRGEEAPALSHTLQQAKHLGMQLCFISREDYAAKKIPPTLRDEDYYIINEGGFGETGAKGAAGIASYFNIEKFTHIGCAVGTGTMMAGLLNATSLKQNIIGISALKNNKDLEPAVRNLLHDKNRAVTILHDYHFGGYAKYKPDLISFMNDFFRTTGIPSDFVYTGKMFYAIADLIRRDYFPSGSKLLLIHSGGLQGNESLPKGTLIF